MTAPPPTDYRLPPTEIGDRMATDARHTGTSGGGGAEGAGFGGGSSGDRASAYRLAAYTFLILFFELAFIRYLPANVKVFSYYVNFVLIAAFVGMGTGLLAAHASRRLRWAFPPLALLLLGLANWFSNILVRAPRDPDEPLWAIFSETAPTVTQIGILPTVAILFVACALFFVPLGALVAEEFRKFRPLVAYSVDIGGSLTGIVAFAVVSYLGSPPWLWFGLGFVVLLSASFHRPRYAAAVAVTAPLAIALVATTAQPNERWSPYYRIDWFRSSPASYTINVNGSMHLTALDLSESGAKAQQWVEAARTNYLMPFEYIQRFDTVLVLGAGAGNDVALLLARGAKFIDAVEIDPQIIELGRELHFQHPYDDPRVNVHVNDARAYLKQTSQRYDLIVFGTLDSQALLSGMSSVRLDNYVYTLESLRAVRDVLRPEGQLIMYHMSPGPSVAAKIFQLLTAAFEEPPRVFHWTPHTLFNFAFVSGSWSGDEWRRVSFPKNLLAEEVIPTDDWPYLYLKRRTLPLHYLKGLAIVLAFSALLVTAGGGRQLGSGIDPEMFFLGLGFLLLETKSVTEVSLLFGSTWEVNLLVFSSILLVILAANWLILTRRRIRLRPVLIALLISLTLGYAVPVRAIAGGALWMEWILGGILVALPIFFAALVFATLFKQRANSVQALGYNLFGAAVGGVLEYSVMILGIKMLYLIAGLPYVLVWMLYGRTSSLGVEPKTTAEAPAQARPTSQPSYIPEA